jgi:NAD(P)-dependent dehydrogenase (short-subunit alcohol dehydrogenase family)
LPTISTTKGDIDMKTWFITGASRGFGRIWTEAALKRGDRVTATARKLADVANLKERFGDAVLPVALDVTNPEQVQQVVQQAYWHVGRLDVLVNNAGVSLIATVEEASDEQIYNVLDANYFGMVRVLRAALPLLRQQGSGHILGVSSGLGIMPMPLIGFYSATKAAVEALHETMAQEVKAFGIKVTLIEPGPYATDFGKSAIRANGMEAYEDFRKQILANLGGHSQARGHRQPASAIRVRFLASAEGACRIRGSHCHLASVGGRLQRSTSRADEKYSCIDLAKAADQPDPGSGIMRRIAVRPRPLDFAVVRP